MCSSSAAASPRSISAFRCAIRIRRWKSAISAISNSLTQLAGRRDLGDRRAASASTATITSMSYYLGIDIGTFESKGVIVDGKGKIVASRVEAAQDAGAAAGLGRAPAEAGLVGRFHLHLQEAADGDPKSTRKRSARSARAPSARACCRSTPTARRCPTRRSTASTRAQQGRSRSSTPRSAPIASSIAAAMR